MKQATDKRKYRYKATRVPYILPRFCELIPQMLKLRRTLAVTVIACMFNLSLSLCVIVLVLKCMYINTTLSAIEATPLHIYVGKVGRPRDPPNLPFVPPLLRANAAASS